MILLFSCRNYYSDLFIGDSGNILNEKCGGKKLGFVQTSHQDH